MSLPEGMKRSMSRQAEAERERRARIITADGEYQASKRLAAAAAVMAKDPAALQLRLLQTVVEVAGEKNSTLVMPVPVELLRFFEKMAPGPVAPTGSTALADAEAPDLGDAEVAAAEAAIAQRVAPPAGVPELADVPPVPEVPALPEVGQARRSGSRKAERRARHVLRCPAAGARATIVRSMTKWEYVTVPLLTHATKQILDNWGDEGYELVAVVPGPNAEQLVAYMKRPKA